MRTVTFQREDGSEALLTEYDDGSMTLADRAKSWESWGVPSPGVVSEPYDYRTDRHIEDLLTAQMSTSEPIYRHALDS